MSSQSTSKMSLVAQYDDLCRYTRVLTAGPEEEFKTFIESQLKLLSKWKESESKVMKLNEQIAIQQSENKRLETKIKHLKNLVQEECDKTQKIDKEKKSLERRILLIKEILSGDVGLSSITKEKLGFLRSYKPNVKYLGTIEESNGSLLSLTDADPTGDDFLENFTDYTTTEKKEKRRISGMSSSSKKKKFETIESSDDHGSLSEDDDCFKNDQSLKSVTIRCNSEPASCSPVKCSLSQPVHKSDSAQFRNRSYGLRRCNTGVYEGRSPVGRFCSDGKLNRTHVFVVKTLYRPERCYPCQSNIGFLKQALKCRDCRVISHPECKDNCPLQCIPLINTPTKGTNGLLVDYAPTTTPMIPPLIVYCVNEIESRGLKDIGLYRISGGDREIKLLKEKFLNGRSVPCLYQSDVHALCGTIKEFLRSLGEPLITRSAWQDFAAAADVPDSSQSINAISDIVAKLPQAHKDTLAFLILHLQRIAQSPDCRMAISSLSKMFGPSVVGFSVPDPVDEIMFKETESQIKIMERLLSIPSDFWKALLNVETDVFLSVGKTPETIPAPKGSRYLGPYASGQKNKSFDKTPISTRNSKHNRSVRMPFFSPRVN